MDLESIPGVGEKTARALSTLEDPDTAIRTGDVATLANAPGITDGRAVQIARNAIMREHDDPGTFLGTPRAKQIHRNLLSLLQERTETAYGNRRLETFYPSCRRSRIEEVRRLTRRAIERDPTPETLEAFDDLTTLTTPTDLRVRNRCLATSDAERYQRARDRYPELSVELVEDARGLADLAKGYSTVVALDRSFAGIDIDGDVQIEPDALDRPEEVLPERILSFFATNRDTIRAAVSIHDRLSIEQPCDVDTLLDGIDRLDADGRVTGDEELDRLRSAVADLDATVSTAESVANDRLREAIEERDVTIDGADLLSLVERGAGVDSVFTRELADEYDEAIDAASEHLVDSLRLEREEAERARAIFPEEPTFPVQGDSDRINRLSESLETAADRREIQMKRELATDLADLRDPVESLVGTALDLDVELAIARFHADFDCSIPTFDWEGSEAADIVIEGGRSPVLDVPNDAVDPVDYRVDGVRLLSGVNSGGKTSTLDLIASVVILAHMGLPVPADHLELRRFDDLHYHAKTQGTLDAGAFESTVREFASLVSDPDGSLLLVDELESITEPGASAKIIAGILETLHDAETTAVFVSHLAREIRAAADAEIPVDGIEAIGLVDGELEVERSPVSGHLARSTPELIVEKLANEREEPFFDRLLEKFE